MSLTTNDGCTGDAAYERYIAAMEEYMGWLEANLSAEGWAGLTLKDMMVLLNVPKFPASER